VATIGLAGWVVVRPGAPRDRAEKRLPLLPPPGTEFRDLSLSPDGRYIAFTAVPHAGGKSLLWVRSFDSLEPRALADTEDAAFAFWSPTSDALGFFANGKLWTVARDGGNPRIVAAAPDGRGGSWNREGVIVFAAAPGAGLSRVAASGGGATPITTLNTAEERGHFWPEFLPDGNHFLFLMDAHLNELARHHLMVGALDGRPPQRILDIASSVTYASGHLFYRREKQLLAQPFDVRRFRLEGEPSVVAETVQEQSDFNHKIDLSASADGMLAYRSMQSAATRLVWRNRTRILSALANTPAQYTSLALSPDGSRVAVSVFDPRPSRRFGFGAAAVRSDIWMFDRATGSGTPFTLDPAADWGAVWSPDGRTIVFSSNRTDVLELYEMDATGASRDVTLLTSEGINPVAQSWSPDGRFIVYVAFNPETRMDLWLLPMSGDRRPVPLLRTPHGETQAQVSPDGRWFAYTSDDSGRNEVYVDSFPTPGSRTRISTNGGGDPRWRPDGKELLYIAADRQLMSVPVNDRRMFASGAAVPLFDTGMPPYWYFARNLYDVDRDGNQLMMAPVEDDRAMPFTIVFDWKNEERRTKN
jgi:Tol biopolymer transport system component